MMEQLFPSPRIMGCLISLIATTAMSATYSDTVSGAKCSEAAAVYLEEWQARGEFLPSPEVAGMESLFRSPTEAFGVWTVVQVTADRITGVSRISPDEVLRVSFDDHCEPSSLRSAGLLGQEQSGATALRDADAERILNEFEAGIFYSWSPHMNLSVSGYHEIESAATALGLHLVPILSDHANQEFASEELALAGIPTVALVRNRSVELIMRDLQVHAPAILVFANGEFVSPTLPGFRYAKDYEELISRFLD